MVTTLIKNFHYGYIIVFCCCMIMGVNTAIVMNSAGIFYGPASAALGVTVGQFGMYLSIVDIFSVLTLTVAGKLIDRCHTRWLLAMCSGVLGGCYVAMSFFNNVYEFYLAGAIIGIAMAFLLYLSIPTLINRWFKTKVGFYIGMCSAFSGIGGMLFNLLGAYWITQYGWRAAYMLLGLIILLIVSPLLALLLRDSPADMKLKPLNQKQAVNRKKLEDGIVYFKAVKSIPFFALIIFAFMINAVSKLSLFAPKYATEQGFTLTEGALIISAIMAGTALGKVLLGWINDKSPMAGLGIIIIFGVLGLMMLLSGSFGLIMLVIGGFFFGWEVAGSNVGTPCFVRAVFGRKDYAKIYADVALALAAGGAVGAAGWGFIADYTGYRFIFVAGIICLVIIGFIGLCALKHSLVKERK